DIVWPYWPTKFRTSSSQAEGADREFAAATLEIIGKKGRATHVRCARVDTARKPLEGTEFDIRADLVLIAIGFAGPLEGTYMAAYDFAKDRRTNIDANTDDYRTNGPKVYAAGDVRRGQSLVVWAIREGRQAARAIDLDLMGETTLPR
ncbi:MAG: FAD-dependent oxidoreductase, partial [Pseudomonadota bacterium]